MSKPVAVIGAGSFGTAITNLLSYNTDVLLYSRNPEQVVQINQTREHLGLKLSDRVQATGDLQRIAAECDLLFPVVPSENFRSMMVQLSPHLRPYHILIHGTKGFDIRPEKTGINGSSTFSPHQLSTMSEVIRQESVVLRVGCLSGPNLAGEIMEGQPSATVIASHFREVINRGKQVLSSKHFQVFGTGEIRGAELAGVLKNAIAIGSGILGGLGMGKNIQALLITRGLMEMISFGQAMGASAKAFVGTAGIGDLVCTATSTQSRNYTFGMRLGRGEAIQTIKETMPELAEGVRTIQIAKQLADYYNLQAPITQMLYRVVYEAFPIPQAIEQLMRYPYYVDVDFI